MFYFFVIFFMYDYVLQISRESVSAPMWPEQCSVPYVDGYYVHDLCVLFFGILWSFQ